MPDVVTNDSQRSILKTIAIKAMQDKEFLTGFPPEALSALQNIKSAPIGAGLKDMRSLAWCSIDNDDSEDLDQLSVAIDVPGKGIKILVAVADVDSIVTKQSVFEDHAKHNTTSVYTSAIIFPMLPEKLSTDLTSLKFNADRPAIVVEYTVAENGVISDTGISLAVVNNKAKLAYNSLADWFENKGPMPEPVGKVAGLAENLRMQEKAAQQLKGLRHLNGALYLQSLEARPEFEGDKLKDLKEEVSNTAKDIIQEFMIAANGVTARFLHDRKLPSLRRIVRVPKNWGRIVELAAEWDYKLPQDPDSKALDQFLHKAHDTDPVRFPDLSLSVIKLLGRGEYVVEMPGAEPIGHFGLAVRDYTHSTAPNRRYPDLITQRMLKAALAGAPSPYPADELNSLASHCTTKEDDAKKVERLVEKSTAALLLKSRIGDQFDAIVTGASEKGTWVRLLKSPVEGKLISGANGLDVGQTINVKLTHTDVQRGFIDFTRVH